MRYRSFFFLVASLFFVAVFEYVGMMGWVRAWVESAVAPIERATVSSLSLLKVPWNVLTRSWRSYTYVLDLELRSAELLAQASRVSLLENENHQLRQLLGQPTRQTHLLTAPILAYTEPLLGLGENDGVHTGDLVFLHQLCIGRVSQVTATQSLLELWGTGSHTPLFVQTETGVLGVIPGNKSQVTLTEIPPDADISVGQTVTTVGQVGIPAGLPLGKVHTVFADVSAPSKQATIAPLVSFYQATAVEVRSP